MLPAETIGNLDTDRGAGDWACCRGVVPRCADSSRGGSGTSAVGVVGTMLPLTTPRQPGQPRPGGRAAPIDTCRAPGQ